MEYYAWGPRVAIRLANEVWLESYAGAHQAEKLITRASPISIWNFSCGWIVVGFCNYIPQR